MKISNVVTVLAICVLSVNALAEKVSMQFNNTLVGLIRTANSMERVYIQPTADGKVRVSIGRAKPLVVEATVIKDSRPTDGPLSLKLGEMGNLIVGSGFSPDGTQSFTFVKGSEQIQLKPLVFLNIQK